MAGNVPFPGEINPKRIVQAIVDLFSGRSNAVGSVTLTINVGTTTVTAPNCGQDSHPILFPAHANAAAEVGNGTIYISAVNNGSFVITHANSATGSRTFHWIALG